MWEIWDKLSDINGVAAQEYLKQNRHLLSEDTIFIKKVDDKVIQVESKRILGDIYNIDITLDNSLFIIEYEDLLKKAVLDTPALDQMNPYENIG